MKTIWESLVLAFSFVLIFVWNQTPLGDYTVPILGFLIALYLIISARRKGKGFLNLGGEGPWGIFILNTVIFLVIFSTGALNSSLFFLLYFLSFGIAFALEPITTFVFVLGAILIFWQSALAGDAVSNFLKVGSIALISPLAFFFGREYKTEEEEEDKIESLKERTADSADTISEDIEDVIKDEKVNLKDEDMKKLNEVLEETEDLRAESKE